MSTNYSGAILRDVPRGTLVLPDSVLAAPVTRTSVNGAGDTSEETLYTYNVPADVLEVGDTLQIIGLFQTTSSVTTKRMIIRLGGQVAGLADNTAEDGHGNVTLMHVYSATEVALLNSFSNASSGAGSDMTLTLDAAAGFAITYTCNFGTPVAANIIRLKAAKVLLFHER
jgi:hypothetical protein